MSSSPVSDRYSKGMATRRAVLGDRHVDRAEKSKTAFDEPFQDLITEAAWGHVWSRPEWTKRERSMVTIALLAALGHDEEVAMHVRATANTGATPGGSARGACCMWRSMPACRRPITRSRSSRRRSPDR